MKTIRLTVTAANCRCGTCKAGDVFLVRDVCPPICHELWNCAYPQIYALQNGGDLDCGDQRAKTFTVRCPDEGRVVLRGEVADAPEDLV